MPSPEMTALIVLIIGTLTPLLIEFLVQPARGYTKKLDRLFWILAPLIGFMGQLGLLLLIPYPTLAGAVHLFVYLLLVVVSNAKNRVLRMVYAVQDSENLRHLLLYPSFYVVHVGAWRVALFSVLAVTIAVLLVRIDSLVVLPIGALPVWASWAVGVLAWYGSYRLILMIAASILTKRRANQMGLDRGANADSARYGLFPTIFLHSVRLQRRERLRALAFAHARRIEWPHEPTRRPHIIALQGESYMDTAWVDRLTDAEDPTWGKLQTLRNKGVACGALDVPCWGAYTMQTEMAVLTGIPPETYGVAKLNPYQALAARQKVWSIAAALKSQGYRTVCLHPAKKGFFRRHKAIPNLGFDEFIGLEGFEAADRYGLYTSDEALAQRIEALIADSKKPLFIHAITIESHGPWVPGRLAAHVDEKALQAADPTGDISFALYRQHMNRLLDVYRDLLEGGAAKGSNAEGRRPRAVALFGDHQPAHGPLFDKLGISGDHAHDVGYCLGHSQHPVAETNGQDGPRRQAQDFGFDLLRMAGFRVSNGRPIEDV